MVTSLRVYPKPVYQIEVPQWKNENLTNNLQFEIGYKLLLFTNKLYAGFQLVPKLLTLSDPELRKYRYFALFHRIW